LKRLAFKQFITKVAFLRKVFTFSEDIALNLIVDLRVIKRMTTIPHGHYKTFDSQTSSAHENFSALKYPSILFLKRNRSKHILCLS